MEMVNLLEGVSKNYKDMMEINWDSGMGIVVKLELGMGIVVKLVRFLDKYKKAIEINWDAGMRIVMEMVKLLEWVSGKDRDSDGIGETFEGDVRMYKDVMEINWDSGMGMGIVVKLVRFLEKYKKAMEINWDTGMGIVTEMVKLLEGMSEECEDVMEIN
ncbi:hypothetical protein H0E87_001550 [Populus deltoides]|uniref:Uncharacterized protein n=1 Tax=Populus deltoides TaxID=3696 RepID=A0A8T2ZRQ7_POPDE|nr:hypothetical protein H0E87_001550 [Populus deltoides]